MRHVDGARHESHLKDDALCEQQWEHTTLLLTFYIRLNRHAADSTPDILCAIHPRPHFCESLFFSPLVRPTVLDKSFVRFIVYLLNEDRSRTRREFSSVCNRRIRASFDLEQRGMALLWRSCHETTTLCSWKVFRRRLLLFFRYREIS